MKQSYLNRTYYIMAVTYNIDNTEKLVFITNEIHNSVLKYVIYVSEIKVFACEHFFLCKFDQKEVIK